MKPLCAAMMWSVSASIRLDVDMTSNMREKEIKDASLRAALRQDAQETFRLLT